MPHREVRLPLTLGSLIPPPAGYPYFEARAAHPFTADAGRLGGDRRGWLANAGWLADASLLAYAEGKRGVREALRAAGVGDGELGVDVLEGPSTQCLALTTGDFAILAFRGTRLESFPDPLATLADFL